MERLRTRPAVCSTLLALQLVLPRHPPWPGLMKTWAFSHFPYPPALWRAISPPCYGGARGGGTERLRTRHAVCPTLLALQLVLPRHPPWPPLIKGGGKLFWKHGATKRAATGR